MTLVAELEGPAARRSWKREAWRWALAVAGIAAAIYTGILLTFFILSFGLFPEDWAEPTAAFLLSALLVTAGSLLVPRYRAAAGVIMFLVAAWQGALGSKIFLLGNVAGALVAAAFAWWFRWFHRRTPRSTFWVSLAAGAAVFAFLGFVYARYVDWPARPEPLARDLAYLLGPDASRITAFYRYDLFAIVETQQLWRIDAQPDVVARVVYSLGVKSTKTLPQWFWRMPPYYWPRSMPAGGEAFQSHPLSTGEEGVEYVLLLDKARGKAFVWYRFRF